MKKCLPHLYASRQSVNGYVSINSLSRHNQWTSYPSLWGWDQDYLINESGTVHQICWHWGYTQANCNLCRLICFVLFCFYCHTSIRLFSLLSETTLSEKKVVFKRKKSTNVFAVWRHEQSLAALYWLT